MTRARAIAYAALTAVEIVYVLRANLPSLWPPPSTCSERRPDVCVLVQPPFPWLWIALTTLLLFSAILILLRRRAGVAIGFAGQALLLPVPVRDAAYSVGSFLFTGSGYDGIDPDFKTLASAVFAFSVVVGPALTLLVLMRSRPAAVEARPARVAAGMLLGQVIVLAVAAAVVFRATLHDCEFYGENPPTVDGVPWCTPWAQFDLTPILFELVPPAAVLVSVVIGVLRARDWAITAGIVWQALVALLLAAMGLLLSQEQNQNAWYNHFPTWTSPRQLAYALIFIVVVPALAALLAARAPTRGQRSLGELTSFSQL